VRATSCSPSCRARADDRSRALFAHLRRASSQLHPLGVQVLDEIPKTISEKPQVRFLEERLGAEGATVHRYEDHRPPRRTGHGA
jgi:hypothetical protein